MGTKEIETEGSFSQPTASSPTVDRKRTRNYSENFVTSLKKRTCNTGWPKRGEAADANTIFSLKEGSWCDVDSVICGIKSYPYVEHFNCSHDIILSNFIFKIITNAEDMELLCKPYKLEMYSKAKFLYETVKKTPAYEDTN